MTVSARPWLRCASYFRGETRRCFSVFACTADRGLLLALLVVVLQRIVDGFTHPIGLVRPISDAALAWMLPGIESRGEFL